MQHLSGAHFFQAEITQLNRWEQGPLELILLPDPKVGRAEQMVHVHEWNATQRSGFLRPGRAMDGLKAVVPYLEERRNPNMVLVPTFKNCSALDVMLAGLLPDELLQRQNLERRRTNMSLIYANYDLDEGYGGRAREAFAQHIWSHLCPRARLSTNAFAADSPLRLLAGDTRFWAHRLYRLAIERRDSYFDPTTHEDPSWEPIERLRDQVLGDIPETERMHFEVTRPLMGGDIWDVFDADERQDAIRAAIDGDGVFESLEPVIELLHTHRVHQDFSERHSWIKEDFERSFYSKRARLKVDLIETVDDAPAYNLEPDAPYDQLLFRDVIAMLDQRDRRLVLALRMGKTASTIAREANLRGHASVSRRITALKKKIARLLD